MCSREKRRTFIGNGILTIKPKKKLTKQEQQTKDNLKSIKLASKSKNPRPSLWKWSILNQALNT